MSDQDYYNLTGITKDHFASIISTCKDDWNQQRKVSLRNSIGILLTKLRTGNSSSVLATLFQMSKSGINKAITRARKVVTKNFVPRY